MVEVVYVSGCTPMSYWLHSTYYGVGNPNRPLTLIWTPDRGWQKPAFTVSDIKVTVTKVG